MLQGRSRMGLRLQETRCSSQVLKPWRSYQKTSEEELVIKTRQQSRQKDFDRDLILKLDRSSTQAVSIENYEIKNSKSDFQPMLMYLCRVSFLTSIDIYKDFFKGRRACIVWPEAKIGLVHHSLRRRYCVFMSRVL